MRISKSYIVFKVFMIISILVLMSCSQDKSVAPELAQDQEIATLSSTTDPDYITNNLHMKAAKTNNLAKKGVDVDMLAVASSTTNVGYYDMFSGGGSGNPTQVAPIVAAGHTPVQMFTLSAAELSTVDVLFLQNPSNGGFGGEYLSQLSDITTAVSNGLVLIVHDRTVTNAQTILPGGGGITMVRDFTADRDIDILDNTTKITNGPGGVVTNTNLDNGTSSNHGYAVPGTLPAGAIAILSRTNPSEIVTFTYPFGSGSVIYSTIPLDFYLAGFGPNPPRDNFNFIYAPNVVAHGVCLITQQVDLDVKPGDCPNYVDIKSDGVIPVAIVGTANLDVSTIDPDSVRLEGIAPVGGRDRKDVSTPVVGRQDVCDCTTGGDDIADLSFTFSIPELRVALGDLDPVDEVEVVLTLTGVLRDGTPFEGKDCVVVLNR